MLRRINGNLVRPRHPHRRVGKHPDHIFHRVLMRNSIPALQNADLFPGMGQKNIDGAGFALPPFLAEELDPWIKPGILTHDVFRAVCAPRGNHNDFGDLHLM